MTINTNHTNNTLETTASDLVLKPASGSNIKLDGGVEVTSLEANGSDATTLGSVGPLGTAGDPTGWLKVQISGSPAYIPYWT
jgi:hypothetical protein